MNYHIITQDKFFDAYIEDIYKLHQEANNVFWVRGEKGELPWLTTRRRVEYLGNEFAKCVNKLRTLNPGDKLFVSWYDMFIGKAILESGINNDVYVFILGGDFYAEPFWYHANWLFDPITLKYLKSNANYGYPQINWKRRPKNWKKIYNEICKRRAFMPEQNRLYQEKLQTVKRINYIVMPEEAKPEFDLMCRLYPGLSARHVYGSFNQNYDVASVMPTKDFNINNPIKLLLGNSADPTNNYFDAFRWLKNQKKGISRPIQIYSVLSYGDAENRDAVIFEGRRLFGDCFKPIVSYMNREEYISFLNEMDVVVMFHNRQQACGNILTFITLGKPVFMKKRNPIYEMLKQQNCNSIYDVSSVALCDIDYMIQTAANERVSNMAIVKKMSSEETRLEDWSRLL